MTTCSSLLLSKGSIFTVVSLKGTRRKAAIRRAPQVRRRNVFFRLLKKTPEILFIDPVEFCQKSPVLLFPPLSASLFYPFEDDHTEPGTDDKGNKQGYNHSGRSPHRDGPHVGPHETRHGGHGEKRRDDRESGKDRGITHFINGLDSTAVSTFFILKWRWMFSTTTMASSTRMPMENMRAKRVTLIECIAIQIGHEYGERKGNGNCHGDDDRFSPPQQQGR